MIVMVLLFFSNFSKNILSILLEIADRASSLIIVNFCSKIEYYIILLINWIIFKIYCLFDCN